MIKPGVDMQISYINEITINDLVWSNKKINSVGMYYNSYNKCQEYDEPSVRTWYMTNIKDSDFWASDGGFPINIRYFNGLYDISQGRYGVFIIKEFNYYDAHIRSLIKIKDLLLNQKYLLDRDSVETMIKDLQHYMSAEITRHRITCRLIYFISIDKINKYDNIILEGIKIAGKLDNLNKPNIAELSMLKSLNVKKYRDGYNVLLNYVGENKEDYIDVKIGNKNIRIKANPKHHLKDKPYLDVLVSSKSQVLASEAIPAAEFEKGGIIPLKPSVVSDEARKIADLHIQELKAKLEIRKLMVEHGISLQRLYSNIIKNEAALIGLEKEEITALKETLKLVKDIVPN